ncbi:N-acetyl-1-D-myo-inositol-2-amino-2-deoxy-alpha-D-glucopyranoside deacetylase [Tamaricihabitans halophyticus]|uniref:1D-myo-inositol 2-acetamido-2-deoxy-alpha-D-glucopyranoside deacetylase n=1 Tax=Tamaricihabitans halophyticus TaxID=1262583 RepID=A0A4R2R174_9PSEU|nr:N-acetyl-1-D-myo-inositol-2-amino-2-deoxy-alpha-D-glucopyranoside deacetylase [Tamaricihabitans halophyticus]TCP56243.1 N-acetyl-1-D-myo-inositol-2-amino-2-deoxy-alpha-D-glucopyranoside deacetylase [Tamaricihabitans halophyticus]
MSTDPLRLLLVHAHPDDESLWTGGTIASYAAAGVQVTVVTCTLGEEGEIIQPELGQLGAWAGDQLGGYRVGELRAACAALGVAEHRFLGGIGRWRDSGMAGTASAEHPRAFVAGDLAEQAGQLAEIFAEVRPQVVIGYDSFGGYGHPDHIRAHEVTMAAAEGNADIARVFYGVLSKGATERGLAQLAATPEVPYRVPALSELSVTEDAEITTVVQIAEVLPAKLRALHAHATQVNVWDSAQGRCYALSNQLAQPIVDAEYYVLASGPAEGAETDLFGGLDGSATAGAR